MFEELRTVAITFALVVGGLILIELLIKFTIRAVKKSYRLQEAKERTNTHITELEAPFILTDKVPTVPGYYWFIEHHKANPEVARVVTRPGHNYLAILIFTTYGRRDFLAIAQLPKAKWGSAPLPQPQKKNDG